MSSEDIIFQNALDWVTQVGEMIKTRMNEGIEVTFKTDHSDLVTSLDKEVETYLVNKILELYPSHNILGEENIGNRESADPHLWLIDPIDGTSNFVNRKKDFGVCVAFCKEGKGVFGIIYNVVDGKLFYAKRGGGAFLNGTKLEALNQTSSLKNELIVVNIPWKDKDVLSNWSQLFRLGQAARGVREYGASVVDLTDIAMGYLGGLAQSHIHPWDYAAGRVILEELGCVFSDLKGNVVSMTYSGPLAVGCGRVHREMIQTMNAVE